MALNKLKKWIGTQAMTAFFDQLNDNVDATNAAIDLVETVSTNVSLINRGVAQFTANPQSTTIYTITFPMTYTTPPVVVATEVHKWPAERLAVLVYNITKTSAEIRIHNESTSSRNTTVNWIAVG